MKLLIPWSGGLDSTALIYKRLKEGHSVTSVRFDLLNNIGQTRGEHRAIDQISSVFNAKFGSKFSSILVQNAFASIEVNGHASFIQPVLWSTFLGVMMASDDKFDAVELAYVRNDDATSYLKEIAAQIRNSYRICVIPGKERKFTVRFPLIKYSKTMLWDELPDNIRYFVHFCEYSNSPCGECPSCRHFVESVMSVESFEKTQQDILKNEMEINKVTMEKDNAEKVEFKNPDAGDDPELQIELPALHEGKSRKEGDER